MDSITIKEVVVIIKDLINISNTRGIIAANDKYSDNHHPEIDYNIGVLALQSDYRNIAKARLISCVLQGVESPYPWLQTFHSNAIGQSAGLLLTQNLLKTTDQEVIAKLFIFGFINLSSCINQMGLKAYESYEMRARMFLEADHQTIIINYFNHIGISSEIIAMLNAYDFYQSSLGGHLSNPRKSDENANKAIYMIRNFSNDVATVSSLNEFVEATKPIEKLIYDKLLGFIRMGVTIEGAII